MRLAALLLIFPLAGAVAAPAVLSGYDFLTSETQALQDDDFANPGMLWVEAGERLWAGTPSKGGQSCADCHGEAARSMRTVGTRYPIWSNELGRMVNLEQRVNLCRTERQHAEPFADESQDMLAITAYVMHQARGLPMSVSLQGPAAESYARGQAFYERKRGQLNLSCANCHVDHVGGHLRGEVISQGQVNGFPVYRQLWQTMGSLNRMFAWCNDAVRAEPYAPNSSEYVDLELYLRARGAGLRIETPAVRR